MASSIGILGAGIVAQTLGRGLAEAGYPVMLSSRSPEKLTKWKNDVPGGSAGTFEQAAAFSNLLILAVKGLAASDVLAAVGPAKLAGKTILDATNPIADLPPVNGVLQYFTGPNESLMERLQAQVPEAYFVKAFSCVGNHYMVHPQLPDGPPTMFICGNHSKAKREAKDLLTHIGWEVADMGMAEGARAIEPLAMLWCIPGMLEKKWTHAFKLLRA